MSGKTPARTPETSKAPQRGAPAPATTATTATGVVTIASAALLQGRDAINIEHNGRVYQLRQTRQGKLILTK